MTISSLTRRELIRRGIAGTTAVGAIVSAAREAWTMDVDGAMRLRAAVPVTDFLDSMGACSSITGRGETLDGTAKALRYTGLRFLRCGLEDRIRPEDIIDLHRRTGARVAYGLLSGGSDLNRLLDESRRLAKAGALLAIEGNNEPNNWGITYKGRAGGRDGSWLAVAELQSDLYRSVKSDAVLKRFPVWNLSEGGAQTDNAGLQFLAVPKTAETLMPAGTRYADFANCHNYITHPSWSGLHDNQTWLSASPGKDCPVDGLYGNYGVTWRNHYAGYPESTLVSLPRVTTETGYAVDDNVNEETQARLYMNLYLSQFRRGWRHTAIYLLRTRSNEPAHEGFALFRMDESPKQAAHALHNLTTILSDKHRAVSGRRLRYSISNQPATAHDILFQKSDGKLDLVLWGERFKGGEDGVIVNFDASPATIRVFDPTKGVNPVETIRKERSIPVTLTNHPVILEIDARS